MSELRNLEEFETGAGWALKPRRSSWGRFLLVGFVYVVLVVGVGVFWVVHAKSAAATRRVRASSAATRFIVTWARGDVSGLVAQTVAGFAGVTQAYTAFDDALGIAVGPGVVGGGHSLAGVAGFCPIPST